MSKIAYLLANVVGIVLLSLMLLFLLTGVVARYLLQHAFPWTEETCTILVVWMGFFGASMGLKERSHVGLVAAISFLPPRVRNSITIAVDCLVGFFAGYLILFGWKLSCFAGSTEKTVFWQIPYFYLYLSVAVGGALLLLQALALILEDIKCILRLDDK